MSGGRKDTGTVRRPNVRLVGNQGTLGTFAGVFTPSILTILGIILFLRLGYVVGSAGLAHGLIIIAMANTISVLTSISLAAISTNLKVKGGGDYYLISRTLGIEFGGAIGTVLFLAQSVSIAFYCIGFGEAVAAMTGMAGGHASQIIACGAVSGLFIFAWLGADWATRFQYGVMALLAAALISFFAGGLAGWNSQMLTANLAKPAGSPDLWILFAIFFPAVTGFTQGVSMSGDLKDPGRSLPLGTFAAVGLSVVVYFGVAVVFAANLPLDALANDYGAMKQVAWLGVLIDAGVISATLSSGMASFLGAPRILQSMAGDRTFSFLVPFAKGVGETRNPRRAVYLSAGIAFATIALGNLNVVAPVVSMFFLISYGLLNYATFFEARSASPSFRPRFRWFHHRMSLAGALACVAAMLAIDLPTGSVAIAVLFGIYQYLKRTAGPSRWADSRRSYHLQQAQEHLVAASEEPEHPRDWRPHLLALSNDPDRRAQLLQFAAWVGGGSGLTTAVQILRGEGVKVLRDRKEVEKGLRAEMQKLGLNAFPLVLAAPSLSASIPTLIQSFGLGPLKANTVLLNWLEGLPEKISDSPVGDCGSLVRAVLRWGTNVVILDAEEQEWRELQKIPSEERRIDVWWWGDVSSRLALLLGYLMTRTESWKDAKIRVLAASGREPYDVAVERLRETLEDARIEAEPELIETASVDDVHRLSADASMVLFPFRLKGETIKDPFGSPIENVLVSLPLVALVIAGEEIDLDAEPEEGAAGELAAAMDRLADAQTKAREAEEESDKAQRIAERKEAELRRVLAAAVDENAVAAAQEAVVEAQEEAEKTARRAAKAQAKAEIASKEVEGLGGIPGGEDKEQERK